MIIDSSVLITFAKINKIDLLIKLYKKLMITKGVFEECVDKGFLIDAPDAHIIKKFIQDGSIEVLELNQKEKEFFKNLEKNYSFLGKGELESITLSFSRKEKYLVLDDREARNVSKLYNLIPVGSLKIFLEAYKKDILEEFDLKESIKKLLENKFRVGGEVINEFWNFFERIKRMKK